MHANKTQSPFGFTRFNFFHQFNKKIHKRCIFDLSLFLSLIFLVLLSSGCVRFSPERLGISRTEWSSYDQIKQAELRELYAKKINMQQQIKSSMIKTRFKPLNIHLSGGKVMFPPFTEWQNYQELSFNVVPESCQDARLTALSGKAKVQLSVCYENGILYFDPSRYDVKKMPGSISFYYSPLWEQEQGFTYTKINTDGYARLKEVNIKIQE